jgi:hypothetical protein
MGAIEIFDKRFKQRFKDVSRANMGRLTDRLLSLFDAPEFHFCRATMGRYYFKYPEISFDRETAAKILLAHFEDDCFSIFDHSEKKEGRRERQSFITDKYPDAAKVRVNWDTFVGELMERYLQSPERPVSESINFFEDRPPKNLREWALANTYAFFDISQTLRYYEQLFALYFPEYPFMKQVSTKKYRRYARYIGNGLYVGFYVDFSFIERELKMTYLELPHLHIEIFSSRLTSHIPMLDYLRGDKDLPIAQVQTCYFIGGIESRVGNSSESSVELQKKLCFHFAVQSFYMKIYMEEVERILLQCVNEISLL